MLLLPNNFLYVYEPHSVGFDRIVATFGEGVVGDDGSIDRRKLGSIVFSNPCKSYVVLSLR